MSDPSQSSGKGSGPAHKGPGLGKVFASVAASFFGVQSSRRHSEDFHSADRNPWPYIVVGVIMTVAFVVAVALVVKLVLRSAGV